MQKAGCSSRKPRRGGREQLVTNMSRSSRCFLSKPSTTLQNISTARARAHSSAVLTQEGRSETQHDSHYKAAGPAHERQGTLLT